MEETPRYNANSLGGEGRNGEEEDLTEMRVVHSSSVRAKFKWNTVVATVFTCILVIWDGAVVVVLRKSRFKKFKGLTFLIRAEITNRPVLYTCLHYYRDFIR